MQSQNYHSVDRIERANTSITFDGPCQSKSDKKKRINNDVASVDSSIKNRSSETRIQASSQFMTVLVTFCTAKFSSERKIRNRDLVIKKSKEPVNSIALKAMKLGVNV